MKLRYPVGVTFTAEVADSRTSALPDTATASRANRPPPVDAEDCSICGAVEALGDTWSILVLRELFFGVRRFNDMQQDLGISRSVLTARLTRLTDLGVVRTETYREPGERSREQYRLTRKGVGLLPVMVALMAWGDQHINGGVGPVTLHERSTGDAVRAELRTLNGRPVEAHEMVVRVKPNAALTAAGPRPAAL